MKITTALTPLALAGIASAFITWAPQKHDKASFNLETDGPRPNERWMSRLPDDTPVSSLSIPGTHNSWAVDVMTAAPRELHQAAHPMHQLLAGIRFFDLYIAERNGHLWVDDHHLFGQNDNVWTLAQGDNRHNFPFLGAVRFFFEQYQSEGLLIRIRRHPQDVAGGPHQRLRFQSAWNDNMRPFDGNPHVMQGMFGRFAIRDPEFTGRNGRLPTLGQLRGRLLLLLDFEGAGDIPRGVERRYDGLLYSPRLFNTEDDTPGKLNNLADIESKWRRISSHLDAAIYARSNDTKTYVTYTSGGGFTPSDFPPPPPPTPRKPGFFKKAVAGIKSIFTSGPRIPPILMDDPIPPGGLVKTVPNTVFVSGSGFVSPAMIAGGEDSAGVRRNAPVKGINMRTMEKLQPFVGKRRNGRGVRAGIVVMDFPGKNLIDAIVGLNFPKPN